MSGEEGTMTPWTPSAEWRPNGDRSWRRDYEAVMVFAGDRGGDPQAGLVFLDVRAPADEDGPAVLIQIDGVPPGIVEAVAFAAQSAAAELHCAERYTDHGWESRVRWRG